MLEKDILTEAKKTIKKIWEMERGNFPIGQSFECPFCHYYSDNCRAGSAKIYPNTMLFKCFACHEARRVI